MLEKINQNCLLKICQYLEIADLVKLLKTSQKFLFLVSTCDSWYYNKKLDFLNEYYMKYYPTQKINYYGLNYKILHYCTVITMDKVKDLYVIDPNYYFAKVRKLVEKNNFVVLHSEAELFLYIHYKIDKKLSFENYAKILKLLFNYITFTDGNCCMIKINNTYYKYTRKFYVSRVSVGYYSNGTSRSLFRLDNMDNFITETQNYFNDLNFTEVMSENYKIILKVIMEVLYSYIYRGGFYYVK